MHMFNCSCDLPENDPTEVYFTEFVPESFEIPTSDITSGVVLANQNEYTHLYLEYTHKHLSTFYDSYASGTSRNYVFRIIFDNTSLAWDVGMGWPLNQVIINYPCSVDGSMV